MYRRRLTARVLDTRAACLEQTVYVLLFACALATLAMTAVIDGMM